MARHTRFPVRATGRRRQTDWGFGPDMLDQTVSSSAKLLGTTSLTVSEGQTIVRIRGILSLVLQTAASAGDGFLGAAGIALVNSDAFAAGIGSIPGPQSDANWDNWMWHSFFDVRVNTSTITDGVNAFGAQQRIVIDSKAMRKWDPAETLVLMCEFTESGAASVNVNCDSRLLLKAW